MCVCVGWRMVVVVVEGGRVLRLYDPLDENKHVHLRPDDVRDVSCSLVEKKTCRITTSPVAPAATAAPLPARPLTRPFARLMFFP